MSISEKAFEAFELHGKGKKRFHQKGELYVKLSDAKELEKEIETLKGLLNRVYVHLEFHCDNMPMGESWSAEMYDQWQSEPRKELLKEIKNAINQ